MEIVTKFTALFIYKALDLNSIELLVTEVKQINDWRQPKGKRYKLHHILAITILAIIAGADDYVAFSTYCKSKCTFLINHGLLDGKNYPSHDLFRQLLQALDKEAFAKLLALWLQNAISQKEFEEKEYKVDMSIFDNKKMIHIDGKSLRASRKSNQHSRSALQIVTAYCSNHSVSIGQSIIDKKSCEKTAIPKLLKVLDLKDSLVTIDAIATTPKNAALIIDAKADYLLALKKNNKFLYLEVESFFNVFEKTALIVDFFENEGKAHGRQEKRTCQVISNLSYFPDTQNWNNLKSLICITSQRTINSKTSVEKRYYLSSLPPNAQGLAKAVRKHWTVENELHWSLDVSFNEDKCRIKHKQAAANLATLRRFALGLLKNAKVSKLGIKNQRLQAAWDDNFLEQIFNFFLSVNQEFIV